MKPLKFLLPILFLCINCAFAANQNRAGTVKYHNFVSYAGWVKDSANSYQVASSDTLFLLADSAQSTPFTTAAIGRNKSPIEGVYDRVPDSLTFLLMTYGEADAVSYEFNVQYSLTGKTGPWFTYGTPDTITVASAAMQLDNPRSRVFLKDAMIRATVKTTTATDITRVRQVRISPTFR